jgi:predicted RNase H-like nuclease (RuvC/YqgF family)
MKAILYIVALLVAGGACYYTLEHARKFEVVQENRLATIKERDAVLANAYVKEKELKDEREVLVASKESRDILTQSIEALKSTAKMLERDLAEMNNTLGGQKEEFAELEKTLLEINSILKGLGGDVNLDNLHEKIEQIEENKKGRVVKLDELQKVMEDKQRVLANTRAELDRLNKRDMERSSRIARNSMESVITAVNQDWGFLVIGAGSNSGFTPQTSLIVQRDGRLIGRVVPSAIGPTQTVAEIDFKSLAPGVRLQRGDRVMLATPVTN